MSAVTTALGVTLLTATAVVVYTAVNTNGASTNLKLTGLSPAQNVSLLDPNGPEVQFILFTRGCSPYNLKLGNPEKFNRSCFNTSNPTKIIVHGFLSSIKEEIFVLNKNAYLETGDYNVIGMDWSVLCEFEYLSALRGVQKAGVELGKFIDWIFEMGVSLDDIHLIGHSLGAHVSAIGGDRVTKGRIARISGLDPAGPGFNDIQPDLKLDPGDAKLVDVIHTYMKILSLAQPLGHVDFYPNGGRFQPGCPDIYDLWKVAESLTCNHARAYHLFAESIRNQKSFRSKRCQSVDDALNARCFDETDVYMGNAETYTNGLYYIKTKATKPYSFNEK